MRGQYDSAVVHDLATKAERHWKDRFDARRQEYIETVSVRRRGFVDRRLFGAGGAIARFEDSVFNDGESGGAFWFECDRLDRAKTLRRLSDRTQPITMHLDEEDMATLHPVAEPRA